MVPIGIQVTEVLDRHRGMKGEAAPQGGGRACSTGSASPTRRRRLKEYPHQLSGGMRQRALIAMAVACAPRLLIADEPTTALDVTIQAQILELLKELVRDSGTALIMITHDLGVVAGMCDTINVLYAGRVVETAPAHGCCSPQPTHPYTVGLLGSIPRLDSPRGEQLTPIPGSVRDVLPWPEGCAFAPRCFNAGRRVRGRAARRCVHGGARTPTAASTRCSSRRWRRSDRAARRIDGDADPLVEVKDLKVHFPITRGRDLRPGDRPRQGGRRGRPVDPARARRTGWSASPAAASRRSAGRCCS